MRYWPYLEGKSKQAWPSEWASGSDSGDLVPQTARYALPGLGNVWQFSLKDTSLISIVGLVEVMRTALGAGSTKQPFTFYLTAFFIFLVLPSSRSARSTTRNDGLIAVFRKPRQEQ